LQYAYYSASPGDGFGQIPYNQGDYFNDFGTKTSEIRSWAPTQTGVTYKIGGYNNNFDATTPIVLYDISTPSGVNDDGFGVSEFFAIDHRGYLYTVQPGPYTFTLIYNDEILYAWTGPDMNYQEWYPYPPVSFTETYDQGQYVPLRFLFVNAQGGAGFSMQITAPDGTVIMDENSSANDYIIQYCDQGPAVAYPSWGQW
jgi:hypothetical protein